MSPLNNNASGNIDTNLTNCDLEPIHFIGTIQPCGFLIGMSADWHVTHVSANVVEYLGISDDAIIGSPLCDVLSAEAMHTIGNQVAALRGDDAVEQAKAVQLQKDGPLLDLAVFLSGQTIVIEAEPSEVPNDFNAGLMVRSMLERMQGQASLVTEAARLIRGLTGFDRVMIYRFHPDGSGEVIAERVRAGLEPFLGLRYPASDIPRQARRLLLRNPVRVLYDISSDPCPIMTRQGQQDTPLDLSMSMLRAHSQMHIEYLRNMGVQATMTVALVRNGTLWGMISCHHMTARHIGLERRVTAELFARMLIFLIESRERDEIAAYETRTRELHNQLVATVIGQDATRENLIDLADRLAKIMPCDGIGVCRDGKVTLKGTTPTVEEFTALRGFLERVTKSQVYATEALGDVYPAARDFTDRAAGMLVIPLTHAPRDYIVFFRCEMQRIRLWAGDPQKPVEVGPSGSRLTPRKSFEAWSETVRGHCAPWTDAELNAADALRVTLLEVVLHLIGATEKEREAATQKQELLIAELNHRVRNILGLISGLLTQSRTNAGDIETFATVLGDRVHALARAHDQITAESWGPGSLTTLITTEAGAYLGLNAKRVAVIGPAILLQPHAFSAVALVIHELMTNAVKYGALANDKGHITIEWRLNEAGDIMLDWKEADGPTVQTPTRRGFGTTIIERSIPHELGGNTTLDYAASGLTVHMQIPSRFTVCATEFPVLPKPEIEAPVASVPTRLSGPVLLVEDNMIIALDTEDMLFSLGATTVTVASNIDEALQYIELQTPCFALLDVNLGTEMSWPIASRLHQLGVPHMFATGYGMTVDCPAEHGATPFITKPYTFASISREIGEILKSKKA